MAKMPSDKSLHSPTSRKSDKGTSPGWHAREQGRSEKQKKLPSKSKTKGKKPPSKIAMEYVS